MTVRLRFVDVISATPTVLLDINTLSTYTLDAESFNFSPPSVRRAESNTILRDGSNISATVFDNRTLSFTLFIQVADRDAMTTAIVNLNRQLVQPRNLLEFRADGATVSKFFRVYGSPDSTVDDPGLAGTITLSLALVSEPFAYGLMVTQAGLSVANNPAAGTRPCYLDVTGVTGSVPTPAIVTITAPVDVSFAIGSRRHGTPSAAVPFFVQCESMTPVAALGPIAAVAVATDANMSGATNNYMRVTLPSLTLWDIEDGPAFDKTITGLTVDHRGTYRAFLRLKRNTAATEQITVRLHYSGNAALSYFNETVTLPTDNTAYHLIDLGLINFPVSDDPVSDPTGTALGVGDTYVGIGFGRPVGNSGAFQIDCDYLIFLPADEELTIVNSPSTLTGADLVLDADKDVAYYIASGKVVSRTMVPVAGAIAPMLTPNQTNRLVFLRDVLAKVNQSNLISESTTVAVSYLPRFLYV